MISKIKNYHFFAVFFLLIREKVVFLHPQNGGTVAQLVEQRTENPRVTGSIPVGTTTKKEAYASFFVVNWLFLVIPFFLIK